MTEKRKRESLFLSENFDFAYKRRTLNSVVDILKTCEKLCDMQDSSVSCVQSLIPSVLDLAIGPQRISVFFLLDEELSLPFSLDNGVVFKKDHHK